MINKYFNICLTDTYIECLINELGDIPRNFHLGLEYVARNKLYTIPLLKNYQSKLHDSNIIFKMFFEDCLSRQKEYGLLQHAVTASYLLEDFIPAPVMSMLSKNYNCDAQTDILKSPFFATEYGKVKIIDRQIYEIENLITPIKIKDVSKEILNVIDNIFIDRYENTYFSCLFNIYAENEVNESKYKKCIQLLKKRNATQRIENLLYVFYIFMDNRYYGIKKKMHLLVYYIKFVNAQYIYTTEKVSYMLAQAEKIYYEIEYSANGFNEDDLIALKIEYCEAMYYRCKMLYNYKECQRFVYEILKYESLYPQFQKHYANAHIWQALIYKEYGLYRKEFKEFVQAIRKYPQEFNIRKSFLMNASFYYVFKSLSKSISILNNLIEKVGKDDVYLKSNLWLYHDWIMLNMYNKEYDMELLYKLRNYAEKQTASNILMRNFNMEGYYYVAMHNCKKAMECFETAVLISVC